MPGSNQWMSYASQLMQTEAESELQQRLGLYQVFLKLYEHHRELLNEILSLETSSSRSLASVKLPYLQGMMLDQPHLITNLQGKTQAIFQPKSLQPESLQSESLPLQPRWVIGRDPQQSTIVVLDRRLSRLHAAIEYVAQQGFYLTDLNSSNGTFVNGEPVRRAVLLQDGDRIRLGGLSFVFFLCASAQEPANRQSPLSSATAAPQFPEPEITSSPVSIATSESLDCPKPVDCSEENPAAHRLPLWTDQGIAASSSLEATFSFLR